MCRVKMDFACTRDVLIVRPLFVCVKQPSNQPRRWFPAFRPHQPLEMQPTRMYCGAPHAVWHYAKHPSATTSHTAAFICVSCVGYICVGGGASRAPIGPFVPCILKRFQKSNVRTENVLTTTLTAQPRRTSQAVSVSGRFV